MSKKIINILAVLFFGAVVNLFTQTPAFAQKISPMTHVFGQQRSSNEDVIYFRNNDVLKGKVLNQAISVKTPYGQCEIPLRKCAGLSFEGVRANTDALVTVNYNRITGVVNDRVVKFQIGTSGAPLEIRKEKIRFILLKRESSETGFTSAKAKSNLFVMTNGDLLVGQASPNSLRIKTDYGEIPVDFIEMETVEMQGGSNVTAVIRKKNGDVMRGTLETEELTLKLSLGVTVKGIYNDKISKIFVGDGGAQALANFEMAQPQMGELDGSAFFPAAGSGEIINSIGMKLNLIPAGSFMMGSPDAEEGRDGDEGPQNVVTFTKPFYLGVYEVTQKEFEIVMGSNPSERKGTYRPVESVSWNDAQTFCEKLSQKEKTMSYRLPTEAEWEYACRAGSTTAYYWGDELDGEYFWYDQNADKTKAVGTKKPNKWGLFDMAGNVWEWCQDWYSDSEYPGFGRNNPLGPSSGSYRVFRGGSYFSSAKYCRSSIRNYNSPDNRINILGFRVLAVPVAGQ